MFTSFKFAYQFRVFYLKINKVFFEILEICLNQLSQYKLTMNVKRSHMEIGLSQANRLSRDQSIHLQHMYKLSYDMAKSQNRLTSFKKIKYQGFIYKIGEFVELFHLGSNLHYIAKLVNIATIIHNDKKDKFISSKIDLESPMIEVEWYMRKNDLPKDSKLQKQWKNVISDEEVFSSGKKFVLPVQAIVCKCQVLTFNEYWLLGIVDGQIYFSRAAYDSITQSFTPSIEQWDKFCICEKPYNPDLEWVQCEKCIKWFHGDCVYKDFRSEEDDYICVNCIKKDTLIKKKKK